MRRLTTRPMLYKKRRVPDSQRVRYTHFEPLVDPSHADMIELETVPVHEIWIDPLAKRYFDPFSVRSEFGVVRVKNEPEVSYKDADLLQKLVTLANHPSAEQGERDNALRRISQIGARVTAAQELEFLNIDRRELFLDNLEVLCEGDCGIYKKGDRETVFVYAMSKLEVEQWIRAAEYAADHYVGIPRRLTA